MSKILESSGTLRRQPVLGDEPATTIRPLMPNDLGFLYAMHLRLSAQSLYYRYLQYRTPSWDELATICHLPLETGEALVATRSGDEEQIIGLAYYVCEAVSRVPTAELAILVEDRFQGQGIGRRLWQQMHQRAQAQQIHRLRVLFDPGNQRILHLIKSSGYAYRGSTEGDLNEFIVRLDEQPQRTQTSQRFSKFGGAFLQRILDRPGLPTRGNAAAVTLCQ
ncbi:MAG: GNAT family N-acetyltransferase [Caldilineaceae bacterium]